ncbi:MAG: glycosyltransferase family 39 protein [Xanthobacteraceae bacterium]|nr:glycosyltransferase family 39 protein [Xanthobacteraceae bacterium]
MTTVQSMPGGRASRLRLASRLRRLSAWLVANATGRVTAPAMVIWFAALHAVLWTVCLMSLKAAQDVHMDVAEAYGWGQKFLLGYGKHPPLSGWIAGLWFMAFPVADWSTYALAMATLAVALVVCWHLACEVVDRRRAFATVLMLAIYPVFNFKGFKYNADLLQLAVLPLIVLAYLRAFEQRTVRAGVWLGLAAVAGMMTKYWAVTVIGTVGLAALLDPDRVRFLRSPAPWVALVVLVVGMLPHVWWLVQVDFAPFAYADDVYVMPSRLSSAALAATYVGHYAALLAVPLLAAAAALAGPRRKRFWRDPATNPAPIARGRARSVWLMQAVLAAGPPLAAVALAVHLKTDWGIPLFFMVPLSLVAWPRLEVRRRTLVGLAAIWLVFTLAVMVASPSIARRGLKQTAEVGATSTPTAQFAEQLTQAWHQRFATRWAVVAGFTEVGEPMTFYSPDHPVRFTPNEVWPSGLTTLEEAKRRGFIGICDTGDNRLGECEQWMKANAPDAERIEMSVRRFFRGAAGPLVRWEIFIAPPAALR